MNTTTFTLITLTALFALASAVTTDDNCNYHGIENAEGDCVCEFDSAGPTCEYARLDTVTLFLSNTIPGVMRWQMGYESEWRGLVSMYSIGFLLILIGRMMQGGDEYPSDCNMYCMLVGVFFLFGGTLWSFTDVVRMLTCDLEPISDIPTTMCHQLYR